MSVFFFMLLDNSMLPNAIKNFILLYKWIYGQMIPGHMKYLAT